MAKALLIVPHFWDPICVPLSISALGAYAKKSGHDVTLFDFNLINDVFRIQREYFDEGKRQFPYWKKWNIERNGTEMLAMHQILYLFARGQADYRELVAEVLNMDRRPAGKFVDKLDTERFDKLFRVLYKHVLSNLKQLLLQLKPDVVGCHLNNSTWPGTLFIMKSVKQILPHVRTVVGGPGPIMGITSNASEVKTFMDANDCIDYFVIGEGEEAFVEILDKPDLARGILDPKANLSLPEVKKRALKIEDLPLPDYGNLAIDKYLQLSVSSSRGCPFECSFCAETIFWKGFRTLEGSKVYQVVDSLARKYGRNSFYLCDSLSNHVIGPLTRDIETHGKPYTIDCYLRADMSSADEKRAEMWRRGGLFRARLGLESANQRLLDAMVKKTTPEIMSKSLDALARSGILTSTLWIACYPGETEKEFEETLSFIRNNRNNIYQADAWLFQYHPKGLAHSGDIKNGRNSRMRFSDKVNKLLAVEPYVVTEDITPPERFDRLARFTAQMESLGIPNPYSIYEMMAALNRWKEFGRDVGWDPYSSLQFRT